MADMIKDHYAQWCSWYAQWRSWRRQIAEQQAQIKWLQQRIQGYDHQWSQIADIVGGDASNVPDPCEKTMAGRVKYEIERLRDYKEMREAEDRAMDIDIDRILKQLPPLTPGPASKALGTMREVLNMPTGPMVDVIVRAAEEIERLQMALETERGHRQADLAEAAGGDGGHD